LQNAEPHNQTRPHSLRYSIGIPERLAKAQLAEKQANENWAVQDLNQKPQVPDNKGLNENHKSETVQNQVQILTIYPDLAAVVRCWPTIPEHIRVAIKSLIKPQEKAQKKSRNL
jgi:hypothetical protein